MERLTYLAGLVRQDIRRHQKTIDRFQVRPGQDPGEAQSILAHFHDDQRFRMEAAEELRRQIEAEK